MTDTREDEVVAYLRENPDFLVRHEDLIQRLTPPSNIPADADPTNVADFQKFMVQRLQARQNKIEETYNDVLRTARDNLNNQGRIHAAILMLLEATDIEEFASIITMELPIILDVDVAALVLERRESETVLRTFQDIRVVGPGTVEKLLPRVSLLQSNIQGVDLLYAEDAGLVKSEALLRLTVCDAFPHGILAFGSREPEAFAQGQGTELISFLARVVERCLRHYLG